MNIIMIIVIFLTSAAGHRRKLGALRSRATWLPYVQKGQNHVDCGHISQKLRNRRTVDLVMRRVMRQPSELKLLLEVSDCEIVYASAYVPPLGLKDIIVYP